MKGIEQIRGKLQDERSTEVMFLSHCLLNTNTRYFGGAWRRGSVNEIIEGAMKQGVGIVQIECPEKRAWGGVLKKYMWMPFDSKHPFFFRLLYPLFIRYTRLVYRRVAASLVKDIRGYIRSGFAVKGVAGVDGSPSCGVDTRLAMNRCFEFMLESKTECLKRDAFNRDLYAMCSEAGSGIFIEELKKQLDKKALRIPIYAHSLTAEMRGESSAIWRNENGV